MKYSYFDFFQLLKKKSKCYSLRMRPSLGCCSLSWRKNIPGSFHPFLQGGICLCRMCRTSSWKCSRSTTGTTLPSNATGVLRPGAAPEQVYVRRGTPDARPLVPGLSVPRRSPSCCLRLRGASAECGVARGLEGTPVGSFSSSARLVLREEPLPCGAGSFLSHHVRRNVVCT